MNVSMRTKVLPVLGVLIAVPLVVCGWSTLRAEKATTQSLGGDKRYLTYVSTDKPLYRPGETLRVRGVILNAADNTPLAQAVHAVVAIEGPKGDNVASGFMQSQDSVGGFSWVIPNEQAGGEYKIKISYPGLGYAPAERKFDIRAYRAPRLKSQIVFLRDGYGPGDLAGASLHVERAEGGIPEGAKVTAIARVDGTEVFSGTTKVDAKGNCSTSFALPKEIERGEGTLAFVIEDGGVSETATKTIPILLQTLDIQIYPEGGDLVAGLPNRVYIEARQPNGKPADIAGIIVDEDGQQAASLKTEHEGRGRVDFSPAPNKKYSLKITQPSGIKTVYALPETKTTGVMIRPALNVFPKGKPVQVTIMPTRDLKKLKVTLAKREVEVDSTEGPGTWAANELGIYSLSLNPKDADGVLRLTVWDDKDMPIAERLIYREPSKKLNVTVTADKKYFVPGDSVKLTVKTTDDIGNPVSGVVGVNVTDDSVLEMIDKREQSPRLPVMVLLESEVKELADAQIYLDEKDAKAPLAVDLLLGTQGWRRFAFVDAKKFVDEHGAAARRVLAYSESAAKTNLRAEELEFRAEGGAVPVPAAAMAVPRRAGIAAAPPRAVADEKPQAAPRPAQKPAENQPVQRARRQLQVAAEPVLEQQGKQVADFMEKEFAGGKDAKRKVMADKAVAMRNDFVVVREYAHPVRPNRNPTDRVDFTETLYWNAGVKTDEKTGEATVSFALNDSVTTFRVFADGFSSNGALGQGTGKIEAVQPFYIEPKLPLEVTMGDLIGLPVGVVNSIGSDLASATLTASVEGDFKVSELAPFNVGGMSRARQMFNIKVGSVRGKVDFTVHAKANPYEDKVTRSFVVKPSGFPIENAFGGMLGADASVSHVVVIPAGVVPNSITSNIAVYPTPLANMTEALQRLIQEPYGCFEQTSSTTYPLVMAQQYFQSHTGVDPALVARSAEMLDKGYKRLISFECPNKGYEWFAGDPGHEALTAFGLLEFTDMAQVREVDAGMIGRTREWMLKSRDGKGGFKRERRALHTWLTDPDCSNAYICWALLCAGQDAKTIAAEIAAVKEAAAKNPNSYVQSLTANVLALSGDMEGARALMQKLAAKQIKDGSVSNGTMTIVGSGGEALMIETTALATEAWLKDASFAGNVENSIRFLAESCKAGRYGSTQSTVLALRAITAYDKQRARPKAPGKLRIFVDGQSVGGPVSFDQTTQGAIKMPDISELLSTGERKIELKMEGGGSMPYSLAVNFNAIKPASSKECKMDVAVSLTNNTVAEGTVTEANVTVINNSKEPVPTPVAIIGVPGGLEVRHDQLKELVKSGKIDAYEVIGREVVLYWREMKALQKVELPLSLVAAIPGTYTAPASRAYLYYTDEFKNWADPMKVTITPK